MALASFFWVAVTSIINFLVGPKCRSVGPILNWLAVAAFIQLRARFVGSLTMSPGYGEKTSCLWDLRRMCPRYSNPDRDSLGRGGCGHGLWHRQFLRSGSSSSLRISSNTGPSTRLLSSGAPAAVALYATFLAAGLGSRVKTGNSTASILILVSPITTPYVIVLSLKASEVGDVLQGLRGLAALKSSSRCH